MTREAVYDAFYDDYTKLNAFLHSHSYTGNALGCRAALATLDIFQDDDVIDQATGPCRTAWRRPRRRWRSIPTWRRCASTA